MKKIIILFFITLLTFIFASCTNAKTSKSESYEYNFQQDFHTIYINWDFGILNFIDSSEFKVIESSENQIKETDKSSYVIEGDELFIDYKGTSTRNIDIYLNKKIKYDTITITGKYLDTTIKDMLVSKLNISSNTGFFWVENSVLDEFFSRFVCDIRHYQSHIKSSTILKCDVEYERIHEIYFLNSSFHEISLRFSNSSVYFKKNSFSNLTINQERGNTLMELNGNKGYTFEINSNDFALDMETVQYQNLYFYKNGEQRVNLNGNASYDIRRYFA
ncbi:MAG: hypothetical protein NC310_04300 [Roseburia sp.]|nr:hypothetical protein [Anaeroplasma bactoclasticum]MCM1196282.1 hypothetical protein [Roseburia sp.]MCM1557389.1 hypothetical protein [Anaeroplasma bactoclasticum]